MSKPRKVTMARSLVVPIVGDAAIAGPIADGRLIPVLILDTSARTDVAELIRVHELLPPGDAQSQWGLSRDNDDDVMLHLKFVRPMDLELILLLSVERQAILVEGMLSGGGVYLQSGVVGDRLSTTLDTPSRAAARHRVSGGVGEVSARPDDPPDVETSRRFTP